MSNPERANNDQPLFHIDEEGRELLNLKPSQYSHALEKDAWITPVNKITTPVEKTSSDQPIEWTDPTNWSENDQNIVAKIRDAARANREGGQSPKSSQNE